MFRREIEDVLRVGVSLLHIGISNWALTKSEALYALDQFKLLRVPVLGGDVYLYEDGKFRSGYENWYVKEIPGEPANDFLIRSIEESRHFIENCKLKEPAIVHFVLVPDD